MHTLTRARLLRRRGGFTYEEALRTGLLDPRIATSQAARYISKHAATELTGRLNPPELVAATDEKAIFYRVAPVIGIPTPRLHGMVGRAGGWSAAAGRVLPDVDSASAFFAAEVPDDFVAKPSAGYHGLGVRVLRRQDGAFVDLDGERHTSRSLAELLHGDPDWELFVIQERVVDHPDLQALSATETLQTLRLTTFVAEDGSAQVVHAGLKLALGGGNVDNFREGATGNALAEIDVPTGEIAAPVVPAPTGAGFVAATGLGAAAAGVRLPLWPEVLGLVRDAALRLMPQRSIGWDVALTARGPLIIEANRCYDPWPSIRFGDAFEAMRRAADEGGRVRLEGIVG